MPIVCKQVPPPDGSPFTVCDLARVMEAVGEREGTTGIMQALQVVQDRAKELALPLCRIDLPDIEDDDGNVLDAISGSLYKIRELLRLLRELKRLYSKVVASRWWRWVLRRFIVFYLFSKALKFFLETAVAELEYVEELLVTLEYMHDQMCGETSRCDVPRGTSDHGRV